MFILSGVLYWNMGISQEKENNIFICFDEVGGEMGGGFVGDCRELIFIDL